MYKQKTQTFVSKEDWMKENGFGEDGLTWCIFGDNTYAIKDQLKDLGCKYSSILKWHSPQQSFDVPIGYGMFSVPFDKILRWDERRNTALYLDTAKDYVARCYAHAEGRDLSEYVGEVGERLRSIPATFKSCHGFSSAYGWTYIYTFQIENNTLVWFTRLDFDIKPGSIINLSGTVKKHEEYRGVKTTQLSHCKIEVKEVD